MKSNPRGFHETWKLRTVDRSGRFALTLQFVLHQSENGFRKTAEIWATFGGADDHARSSWRSTGAMNSFQSSGAGFRIGECEFADGQSRGVLQNRGKTLEWNLSWTSDPSGSYQRLPEPLRTLARFRMVSQSVSPSARVQGHFSIDGTKFEVDQAPGMQSHNFSFRRPLEWTWAHCNSFVSETGEKLDLVFEGFSGRIPLLGPVNTPWLTTLYFRYKGETHDLSHPLQLLRTRSERDWNAWRFQSESGELTFKGELQAENREFIAWSEEDTDGSLVHLAYSPLTRLSIQIYRRGKLEASALSAGTAALEIARRERSPYLTPATS